MRRLLLIAVGLQVPGCGIHECKQYCEIQAECMANDADDAGESFSDWTGYADEDAFTEACFAEFDQSRDEGGPGARHDLNRLCHAEQDNGCL